jgi:hypothetical protein
VMTEQLCVCKVCSGQVVPIPSVHSRRVKDIPEFVVVFPPLYYIPSCLASVPRIVVFKEPLIATFF